MLQALMKIRLAVKIFWMEVTLEPKESMDQVTTKKIFFVVYLKISDLCFYSLDGEMKHTYLRLSSILWFLKFLSYFLFFPEARNKLIPFYTSFSVK